MLSAPLTSPPTVGATAPPPSPPEQALSVAPTVMATANVETRVMRNFVVAMSVLPMTENVLVIET
jgi:hypothetical protein